MINTEERLAEMQALATLSCAKPCCLCCAVLWVSLQICRGYLYYKSTADFVLTK